MALHGLNTLEKLDISQNKLHRAPFISSVKNTILNLDLSRNEITHISDTYFHSFKKIRNIFLDHNQLIQFPNLEYISKSIIVVSLGSNNISNVIPMYGIRFPRLETLLLENNQIRNFCFPPVNVAPRLHVVGLQSNSLQRIDFSDTQSSRKQVVYVFLGHNPWHCNGSLGWTQQCTPETGMNAMLCLEWIRLQGMICASPPGTQGLTPKEAGGIHRGQVQFIDAWYQILKLREICFRVKKSKLCVGLSVCHICTLFMYSRDVKLFWSWPKPNRLQNMISVLCWMDGE